MTLLVCQRTIEWIPIIGKPAVDSEKFERDEKTFLKRIATASLLAISLVAAAFIFQTGFLFIAALSAIPIWSLIGPLEVWRAARAADQLTADHFCKETKPTFCARLHLSSSLNTAQLLIDKRDPTIVNKIGPYLVASNLSLDVFKALVDAGMDIYQTNAKGNSALKVVVSDFRTYPHLYYLAESKRLTSQGVSNDQQVDLWCRAMPEKRTADILKRCGFQPNVRNSAGESALDILKKDPSNKWRCRIANR